MSCVLKSPLIESSRVRPWRAGRTTNALGQLKAQQGNCKVMFSHQTVSPELVEGRSLRIRSRFDQ